MSTLGLLLVLVSTAAAQTWRGSISGSVQDSSGQAISGAEVLLSDTATGRERRTTTDASGGFTFAALPPSDYRIEVTRDNFRKHIENVTLRVNQEIRAEFALLPGRMTEEVSVTATPELLKTESASVSTVIENRQIQQLPLDGRNFYELTLLTPGVAPAAQGSAGTVRGDFAVHVNGAREDSNYFLLDGVYNSDPKLNGVAVTPSVDAIREFEVLTSSYDASFGRNGGGQINVVLKSGTNDLHGTAYEFFRNAALDERNRFAPASEPQPKYQRNQFGVSLGGPLVKNRTFLFGDYEGRRLREGITRIANLPTGLERQGDFSQSAQPPADLFTGQPFPGNRIPAQRIHPIGRAIANLYPLPNRNVTGENFVSSPTLSDDSDNFDLRVDHALGSRTDLAGRYSFSDRDLFDPFSGTGFAVVPGFGTTVDRRGHNAMVSLTHAFAPSFLNETRLGFNRVAGSTVHQNQGSNLNREIGLPQLWADDRDAGLSYISLAGFSPIGDDYNTPQQGITNTYQVLDQATYSRGRHLLKFGFDFRQVEQNAFRDIQARGFLSFFGLSGNSLGDLLQGLPTATGGARMSNPQALRTESYNVYLNDTFRVSPNVVLTAGLRYEFNSPPVDAHDLARLYNPGTGALEDVGTGSLPRSGYQADKNNFAPRLGIVWRPANGQYVIRSGYGFYYDQAALAPGEGLYFSPPYYDLRLFVQSAQAPITLSDPFPQQYPFPTPPSALAFQRDLRTPYMQQWSLTMQRQLGTAGVAEIGYVGSKGTKLLNAREINQPRPSVIQPNLRPNPLFGDVTILESRGNSIYHSMQAKVQQRFRRGVSLLAAYTWAKSIDDASAFFSSAGDPNFPQDSSNVALERGRSSFDVAHRLSLSYSWDLPLGSGKLLGGWQTHGIWTFQSGRPFTVALLPDLDNSNTGRSNLGFGSNDRPNLIGDARLDDRTAQRWFNTTAFGLPPFGTFGNSGRNILEGPGLAVINASIIKNTPLSERASLQFRAEAFNLLNRTNYDLPDVYFGSPTFGRILSAQNPRRLQLGLKVIF